MKKNKKVKKISILLGILGILLLILLIINSKLKTPKKYLEYINSDKINSETISPDFIHVVIATYEGDLNPKSISKSTYYFTTEVIPKYLKKCKNEEEAREYFSKNSKDIKLEIGIESEEEFIKLLEEIQKLKPTLKLEKATFKMDEITRNQENTEANLYIQYENNPEISVIVTISNSLLNDESSIKYSK